MPNSQWPSRTHSAHSARHASRISPPLVEAGGSRRQEATRLLGDLQAATTRLGDAFMRAGFAPAAWRAPEARLVALRDRLPALSEQLPNVTVQTLLARLATFTARTGPDWLAGDAAALAAFAHETRVLAGAIRPLRALAQRQRRTPPAERGSRPLERALGDGRVGEQLDRLARTLRQLAELVPLLEPQQPERADAPETRPPAAAASAPPAVPAAADPMGRGDEPDELHRAGVASAGVPGADLGLPALPPAPPVTTAAQVGHGPTAEGALARLPGEYEDGQGDGAPAWLTRMHGKRHQPEQPVRMPEAHWVVEATTPSSGWLGIRLLQGVWRRRAQDWVLVLVAGLVLLTIGGALVLTRTLRPPAAGSTTRPSATASVGANRGHAVTASTSVGASPTTSASPGPSTPAPAPGASPTPSPPAPTATPTPGPTPARLAVSPTKVALLCNGTATPLTVSNTGGQALTWQASVSGTAVLSATSGQVGPSSTQTISVHASGAQHGPGTITVTSNGGSATVSYTVGSCH